MDFNKMLFGSREEAEQKRKDQKLEDEILKILYLYKGKDDYLIADMIMKEVKKYCKENKNGKNRT